MGERVSSSVPLLEIRSLTKQYSSVPVLSQVSFSLERGCITALIGENGAGKSTLIKCVNGNTAPSSGTFLLSGKEYVPSVRNALDHGIVTIPQEFNLADSLSVRENIFLGCELKKFGFLDHKAMRRRAAALLQELHCDLSPDRSVSTLSIAQKQMVEIARALNRQCSLLIMDEPTTVLNTPEVENLFTIMDSLRKKGLGIVFVSHKLKEVKTICDQIVVLRDGLFICRKEIASVTEQDMANLMVGRELSTIFPEKKPVPGQTQTVLTLQNVSDKHSFIKDISFSLRKGEIFGLAGLGGSGRTELAEILYGIRRMGGGSISINGKKVSLHSVRDAVKAGIAYLPEDRQKCGVIQNFPVMDNMTLISLSRYCTGPFLRKKKIFSSAQEYQECFRIKAPSLSAPIRELSGGNQQKAAIAKSLDASPQIFIFDEPTRGIDVQSRSEIYKFIRSLADRGMACIVISSDLEEVMGLCSRVGVMREGRLTAIAEDEHINEQEIMYLATGVK